MTWNHDPKVNAVALKSNLNTDAGVQAVVRSRCAAGHYSNQERGYIAQEKKEEDQYMAASAPPQMQQVYKSAQRNRKGMSFGGSMKKEKAKKSSGFFAASSSMAGTRFEGFEAGGGGDGSDGSGVGSDSEDDDDSASIAETLTPGSEAAPPPKPKFITQGMTSSYSIPRRMTLPSTHSAGQASSNSSAVRRHAILTVPLTHLRLSYVCTPKLRSVAYLKARVLNSSTTTLRKGLIGITLDGTFIGTTALPKNVYPGGFFNLGLGIDESVTVMYSKPSVKRTIHKSGGFLGTGFGRAESEVVATYGRSTVIRNSRLDRGPIELVVTDQVPVSEDAKLTVNVTWPRGLRPPPSQIAPAPRSRFGDDPGETLDEDSSFGDAGGSKFGPSIKTGTGVYFEGFKVTMEDEPDAAHLTHVATGLVPPPAALAVASSSSSAENEGLGYSKSKRVSFFGSKLKHDGGTSPSNSNSALSPAAKSRQATAGRAGPSYPKPGEPVKDAKWGSAVVAMRRNGETVWRVKLNPGMGVRLGLEYEARVPAGESMAGL